MIRPLPVAVLAIGATLAVAGCGGSDDSGSGGAYGSRGATGSTQAAKSESGGGGTVAVAQNPALGPILVSSAGFTLYDFHKDRGTESACYGACAGAWPPLIASGAPEAARGAEAAQLGTTKRKDGTLQVTYAGHPLYTYAADTKPGETRGHDIDSFGAEWYALQPNGEEAED